MGKNIVVLTGSPRMGGNSFAMTDAFVEAAQAKGHTVTRIDTAKKSVHGCNACYTCFKNGTPCSFDDDDFNALEPAIEAADAIVFATPVYWYSFPAQLKAVLDRTFCFIAAPTDITGKQCGLISCCEEKDMTVFDGLTGPLHHACNLMRWEYVGDVLVPGVNEKGDIDKTDGVARAAAFADKF